MSVRRVREACSPVPATRLSRPSLYAGAERTYRGAARPGRRRCLSQIERRGAGFGLTRRRSTAIHRRASVGLTIYSAITYLTFDPPSANRADASCLRIESRSRRPDAFPATEGAFPASEEACPASEEAHPASEEAHSASEEARSATEEAYSASEEACSASEEACSASEEACSASEEACSASEEACSAADRRVPRSREDACGSGRCVRHVAAPFRGSGASGGSAWGAAGTARRHGLLLRVRNGVAKTGLNHWERMA